MHCIRSFPCHIFNPNKEVTIRKKNSIPCTVVDGLGRTPVLQVNACRSHRHLSKSGQGFQKAVDETLHALDTFQRPQWAQKPDHPQNTDARKIDCSKRDANVRNPAKISPTAARQTYRLSQSSRALQ
jgi:hypothetical protein